MIVLFIIFSALFSVGVYLSDATTSKYLGEARISTNALGNAIMTFSGVCICGILLRAFVLFVGQQ